MRRVTRFCFMPCMVIIHTISIQVSIRKGQLWILFFLLLISILLMTAYIYKLAVASILRVRFKISQMYLTAAVVCPIYNSFFFLFCCYCCAVGNFFYEWMEIFFFLFSWLLISDGGATAEILVFIFSYKSLLLLLLAAWFHSVCFWVVLHTKLVWI